MGFSKYSLTNYFGGRMTGELSESKEFGDFLDKLQKIKDDVVYELDDLLDEKTINDVEKLKKGQLMIDEAKKKLLKCKDSIPVFSENDRLNGSFRESSILAFIGFHISLITIGNQLESLIESWDAIHRHSAV